jgi:hypothetical protein
MVEISDRPAWPYPFLYLLFTTADVAMTIKKTQPDEHSSLADPAGVGEGMEVGVSGIAIEGSVPGGVVEIAAVGLAATGSEPRTETKRNRTRAWARVVLSPRKRKLGVSYGSGKPVKALYSRRGPVRIVSPLAVSA